MYTNTDSQKIVIDKDKDVSLDQGFYKCQIRDERIDLLKAKANALGYTVETSIIRISENARMKRGIVKAWLSQRGYKGGWPYRSIGGKYGYGSKRTFEEAVEEAIKDIADCIEVMGGGK